ncbi:hypothetical protein ACFE04_011687 [Oxalis oulophora]
MDGLDPSQGKRMNKGAECEEVLNKKDIEFSGRDLEGLNPSYNEPLEMTITMNENQLKNVLVDSETIKVLQYSALAKLGLKDDQLKRSSSTIQSFDNVDTLVDWREPSCFQHP